jgi:acetylornithine deacetylase/succinyl-diaminopimelate desuccinylase-like protein
VLKFFREVSTDFEKVKDPTYNPAFSTANLGMLRQDQHGLHLHFDMRLLPDLVSDQIMNHLTGGIKAIGAKYPSLNVTLTRERTNPGLNMTLEHELVKVCKDAMTAANIPATLDKKATSTEAAQYFQAGYEAVIFGPGLSHGNSHSPNEHNLLDHLEKATAFYEKLIERVCL